MCVSVKTDATESKKRNVHVFLVNDTKADKHHAVEQVHACCPRDKEGEDDCLGTAGEGGGGHGTSAGRLEGDGKKDLPSLVADLLTEGHGESADCAWVSMG